MGAVPYVGCGVGGCVVINAVLLGHSLRMAQTICSISIGYICGVDLAVNLVFYSYVYELIEGVVGFGLGFWAIASYETNI